MQAAVECGLTLVFSHPLLAEHRNGRGYLPGNFPYFFERLGCICVRTFAHRPFLTLLWGLSRFSFFIAQLLLPVCDAAYIYPRAYDPRYNFRRGAYRAYGQCNTDMI